MKFSVIIPIYNAELTLNKCLASVENQRFSDFEVLMVNDGSSDRSEEICLSFQEKDIRFRYFYQENQGVSAARNLGMDHSNGEYITFLDSDDFYFGDYLQTFYQILCQYPEAGHYWCAFQEYDKAYNPGRIYTWKSSRNLVALDRCDIMSLHMCTLDGSPWNKIYQRELLNGIRMRPELSLGEDMIFNFQYLDENPDTRIIVDPTPHYGYYCASSASLDHKYRDDLEEIFTELLDVQEGFLTRWQVSTEQWDLFYANAFYMLERVMRNYFNVKCELSDQIKYKKCNDILRGNKMKKCMKSKKLHLNPIYRFAYWTGNYRIVKQIDKLVGAKKYLAKWKI